MMAPKSVPQCPPDMLSLCMYCCSGETAAHAESHDANRRRPPPFHAELDQSRDENKPEPQSLLPELRLDLFSRSVVLAIIYRIE